VGIFDLDATLLDSRHAQTLGLSRLSEQMPELGALAAPEFAQEWRRVEDKHFARFERGEIPFQESRRERLREHFPATCAAMHDHVLDGVFDHYLQGYREGWVLYPDVLPTLSRLPGPFVIVTNGDAQQQREKVVRLGLGESVSDIVVSGDIGHAKPSPRIFQIACQRAGIKPDDVFFIGDDLHRDVMGSLGVGMRAIWLNRHRLERPQIEEPFREIHSLDEL